MYNSVKLEDLSSVAKEIVDKIFSGFSDNKKSMVIYLNGVMGAGKTTFAKYLAKELGVEQDVQSPTFTIMREYNALGKSFGDITLLHIDAYRFEKKEEGDILNLKNRLKYRPENHRERFVVLVEWAENMNAPEPDMQVKIEKVKDSDDVRDIYIK